MNFLSQSLRLVIVMALLVSLIAHSAPKAASQQEAWAVQLLLEVGH